MSISVSAFLQLSAYGGSVVYTVSYTTDQQEQRAIRVTSEPDLVIEVSFHYYIYILNSNELAVLQNICLYLYVLFHMVCAIKF